MNSLAKEIGELNKNLSNEVSLILPLLKMFVIFNGCRYCQVSEKFRKMPNSLEQNVLRSRKYLPQLTTKN